MQRKKTLPTASIADITLDNLTIQRIGDTKEIKISWNKIKLKEGITFGSYHLIVAKEEDNEDALQIIEINDIKLYKNSCCRI